MNVLIPVALTLLLGCTSSLVKQRAMIEPKFPYDLRQGDDLTCVLRKLDSLGLGWDTSYYVLDFTNRGNQVSVINPNLFELTFDSAYFLVDDNTGLRLADFRLSSHHWSWDSIQFEFMRVREMLMREYGEPNITGEPAVWHKNRPDLRNRWRQTVHRPELTADVTWYFTAPAVFWYRIYDGWYTEVY